MTTKLRGSIPIWFIVAIATALLGCAQERAGLGFPFRTDAGMADGLGVPLRTGANIDTRIAGEVSLDGGTPTDAQTVTMPDGQSMPDVKPVEGDTQLLNLPDAQPVEKPVLGSDARVFVDSDPNAHCLQGLVDNGYASPRASCADDITITKARTLLSETIEFTCRKWIDCFIANGCVRQGATIAGSSSTCMSCTTEVAQWIAVSTQWWSDLIVPYCPEFFYTYPR